MFKIRKSVLTMLLLGGVVAGAAATKALSVNDVNKAVEALLVPFNNKTTIAAVKFKKLVVDESLTRDFQVQALYNKTGEHNKLELRLQPISYRFLPNSNPEFVGRLGYKLDLLKVLKREQINQMAPEIEQLIKDTSAEFIREYGDAATIEVKNKVGRDKNNHVKSIDLRIAVKTDFSKLPKETLVENLPFKYFEVAGKIDLKRGLFLVKLEMNPEYKYFKSNQRGLKEWITSLLNNEKDSFDELQSAVAFVDHLATRLVNTKVSP